MSDDLQIPDGFHRAAGSGLIVPNTRERRVLDDGDVKLLQRATKLANSVGWFLTFACADRRCCGDIETAIVKRVEVVGGFELECQHQVVRCVSFKKEGRRRR